MLNDKMLQKLQKLFSLDRPVFCHICANMALLAWH